jgi:hypothetical protein
MHMQDISTEPTFGTARQARSHVSVPGLTWMLLASTHTTHLVNERLAAVGCRPALRQLRERLCASRLRSRSQASVQHLHLAQAGDHLQVARHAKAGQLRRQSMGGAVTSPLSSEPSKVPPSISTHARMAAHCLCRVACTSLYFRTRYCSWRSRGSTRESSRGMSTWSNARVMSTDTAGGHIGGAGAILEGQ